jgi:hypothetical protein
MPSYALSYYGEPQFTTPEESSREYASFETWLAALGDAVVNPGTPLGTPKIVRTSGVSDGGADHLTGFSIVNAESMDAAVEMAQSCPFLKVGKIEVAEVMSM